MRRTPGAGKTRLKRSLRNVHRWIGLCAALFLVVIAVTGLLANHSHTFGLDRAAIRSELLLDAYGLPEPDPPIGVNAGGAWIAWSSGNLLIGGQTHPLDSFHGAVAVNGLVAAAGGDRLLLLTGEGELVESMTGAALPGTIERIGSLDGRLAVQASGKLYLADERFIGWMPYAGSPDNFTWRPTSMLPGPVSEELELIEMRPTITWERLLLDVHSGRIFGITGKLLADLTAIAILYLLISGLATWRRNGR